MSDAEVLRVFASLRSEIEARPATSEVPVASSTRSFSVRSTN
jgi:hypothetical protein